MNWENKAKSAGSFAGFLLGVYFLEPWMITLGLLIPFVKNMIVLSVTGGWKSPEEMEEEEDSSDVSSPPLLPIRPTPTSFFQPFLPRPLHNSSQENNNVIKPLAFSIDNILRPNFGGQGSGPESLQSFFSSPFLQSSAFMAAAAFAAAASAVASTQATPLSTNSISTMPSLSMQVCIALI